MTKAQLGELAQAPVGYDNLSGIYLRAPVVSLDEKPCGFPSDYGPSERKLPPSSLQRRRWSPKC